MLWKKYLKKNIGILGLIIGILSIFLSIYFYKKSIKKPEPILITDPSRTLIINSEHFSDTSLKIIKSDGNEVTGNVTAIRFYFWNNGNKSIKTSNILEPIKITLSDPNAVIVDYKILKTSRKVVAPKIGIDTKHSGKYLSISFEILEKDDGIMGQVIYSGDPKADLVVSGTIEEVKQIITNHKLIKKSLVKEFCIDFFGPILICGLACGILGLRTYLLHRHPQPPVERPEKTTVMGWLIIIIFSIAVITLLVVKLPESIKESIDSAKSKTIFKAIENIPENILP